MLYELRNVIKISIDYRENANHTVYVHIVPKSVSGYAWDKYYVGITHLKVETRWGKDGNGYKTQLFYNAIQKYKWENIEHYIIASNLTMSEACKLEMDLIKELKSNDKKYGYNLTRGGEGTYGISRSGEKNPNYGRTHSDEVRKKMSKNHYDCKGSNNPRAKTIYQFDKDGRFINRYSCAIDAEKVVGNRTNIRQAARCKKIYNGYLWANDEDVIINDDGNFQIKDISKFITEKQIYKKIYQFDNDGTFIELYDCPELAAIKYKRSNNALRRAARTRRPSCGYIWRYEEDVIESGENPGSFILLR